jgi:ubiquinone/menaquinone biosynthesis C-methylase UbiE
VDEFKIEDASSYDAVAGSFAHFTSLVTKPLAETLVHLAELRPQDQILDIGTGSGIVALAAAKRLSGAGCVTGIDLSRGLLAEARQAVNQAGMEDRIRFEVGDAEALPFPDRSFDRVLSMFALLHFPHPERAVAEMVRVLKPGGHLAIGIGSGPPWSSLTGWRHQLSRIPDFVRLRTGKLLLAPGHLNQLIQRHIPAASGPEETDLASDTGSRALKADSIIRQSGLQDVRTYWEGGHLILHSAQEFWDLQSTFSSIARKRLKAATPAQIDLVRKDFEAQCRQVLERGGKLVYHYAAFYMYGRRPVKASQT